MGIMLFLYFSTNTTGQVVLSVSPDNCTNPLPNSGTYTQSGSMNGKPAYYKGANLRIYWTGSRWNVEGRDVSVGGSFLAVWYNDLNTPTPPQDCWQSTFGCFIPTMSGASSYPIVSMSSITNADASPTLNQTVNYTVVFSGTMNNLTTSNFTLTQAGGVSGATVTNVVQNSATTWTVTADRGTGTGTLRLNFDNVTGASAGMCSVPYSGSTYLIQVPVTTPVTLAAGDIAFTGFNADTPDDFSFVVLKPGGIAMGDKIIFTDLGWNSTAGTFRSNSEGINVWEATTAVAQFTEITVDPSALSTTVGTLTTGYSTNMSFSSAGDQILAFQGSEGSPTFIAGVHINSYGSAPLSQLATWDDNNSSPTSSTLSGIPPGLTNGVNAVMLVKGTAAPYTEEDNWKFNCTGVTNAADLATIRSAINNRDNWDGKSDVAYTLPSGCTFSILVASPEMDVQGNGQSIADNDITPSATDDTEFGSLDITTGSTTHTFTIENTGNADLSLSGGPVVAVSGTHASDFTVTQQATSPVTSGGGTTTFIVQFDPSAVGLRSATISIANDDTDENPYNFDIQGTGTASPEMDVQGSGQSIADNDITPSTSDDTDFGSADIVTGSISHTFTIENTGNGDLTLGGAPVVAVSGTNPSDFIVTQQATSPVTAAGGTTTFLVEFNPSAGGLRTATISITNDDADENPYNFDVQGSGTRRIYVSHSATGANDGTSWTNAYTSLKTATDVALSSDKIWIAAGTYQASATDRTATFSIRSNVEVYGGFAGTETMLSQRDWAANPTILSGDIGTQGDNSDNSYNVIRLQNASSTTILDGLIIQDGNANGSPYPYNRGGGISNNGMNSGNSSPTIQNCTFRWNEGTFGGAISNMSNYSGATDVTITGCLFYENTSTSGSAISNGTYQSGTNNSVISSCTFADNVGTSIHNANGGATITVQNSIIWDNGAPLYNYGNEATVQYCLLKSGALPAKTINGGNNLFAVNPEFVHAASDDYSLKAFSPAIDKGSNALLPGSYTSDIANGTRTVNGTVDLGAIERAASLAIIYVNPFASGANDGSSWANAYTSLNLAVNAATSGASIWVTGGTYKVTPGADRTMTFQIANGVKVYGGFAGGETQLSQRDWTANPTILSGDLGAQGNPSDNSYNVIRLKDVSAATILDGLIIENGNANGTTYPYNRGGGISNNGMNSGNSSPTIQNCIFRWNMGTYGGGISNMANYGGVVNATITGCLFYENSSTEGAAIDNGTYSGGSNSSVITNCTFSDNTGISIHNGNGGANITIQNSILWDVNPIVNYANEATIRYSNIYGTGLPTGTTDGGNNQLAMDPMFVDAANDDYKLQGASPAVAAGSNAYLTGGYTLDLAHTTRQTGATVEMGCYEDAISSAKTMANNNPTTVDENTSTEEEQAIETTEEELEMSSLEEVTTAINMTVYPNPVQDIMNIRLGGIQETVHLQLLNTAGQTIQQEVLDIQEGQTIQLDMSRLANGIYLLNLQLEDGTRLNERVVKF
ncbi:MAG: choice-of-anchor D domain-containing protein [Aureispira sp.]|nr:choice-of-anchor D domain-containing protein [Aureispira sp.]